MKNLFKELYRLSLVTIEGEGLWDKKLSIQKEQHLPLIDHLLSEIQFRFQNESLETYREFEKTFLQDIVQLKKSYPDERETINYLQLSTFTNSAGLFNIQGLFTYTHYSIVLSINDSNIKNGDELTLENERFWDLLQSRNSHIIANAEHLIVDWLSQLYYCCYNSGSLPKFGYDLWDTAVALAIDSNKFSIEKCQLLSNLITWNANYKKDENFHCSDFLIGEYYKTDWGNPLKFHICSQIILLKELDNSLRAQYYKELCEAKVLDGHVPLQLLVSITGSIDDFNNNHKLIINAAQKYNDFLKAKISRKVLFVYERARIFKILDNIIILLAKEGKSYELTKILGAYYDINFELNDSILYALPFYQEGIFYFNNNNVVLKKQNTFSLTNELINLSNKLFNRTIALIGDPNDIHIPKKIMGIPSVDFSKLFEDKAYELYNFELISENFRTGINGILQLGFNSIPLQALMLKKIEYTFPIVNSFTNSFVEKELGTILIWTSGSYTSAIEQTAIVQLCEKYNIHYEIPNEDVVNKATFLQKYLNDKYSIIWIASHGEHNNYEPHKSIINISHSETVSIEELVTNELEFQQNRLLVLNLCESGVNSEAGGFKGLGFGHQLVSCKQSIISHLWMVEPRIAMTFGIVLAIGLIAHKKSHFESYCFAVKTLIAGKEQVLRELKEEFGDFNDLIDRIENADSIDWNNILNWGSAAIYK